MAPAELLVEVVLLGLAAGFLAAFLRTWEARVLGGVFAAWWALQKTQKPLGCAVCLGFWCALATCLAWTMANGAATTWTIYTLRLLATAGAAAWLNYQLVPPALLPAPVEELRHLVPAPVATSQAVCTDAWHSSETVWDWQSSSQDWGDPTGSTQVETASCPTCGVAVSRFKRN